MRLRQLAPRLKLWHLLGLVAAAASIFAAFEFRKETDDEGYRLLRRLRALDPAERAGAAASLKFARPPERRAIGPLTEALFDEAAPVRAGAADALGMILNGDPADPEAGPVIAALARGLGERDPVARREIVRALANFGYKPGVIVPLLIELSRSDDLETRTTMLGLLGPVARTSEPARSVLLAALGDGRAMVRSRAVRSLGTCLSYPDPAPEPIAGPIVAALIGAARDEAPDVRAGVMMDLGGYGNRVGVEFPAVVEALGDPAIEVRLWAAITLGQRIRPGSPPSQRVPGLAKLLDDPEGRVRAAAAAALGRIGLDAEDALPSLRASAAAALDDATREEARQAIVAIETAAEALRRRTLPEAIAGLAEPESAARAYAAGRLGALGPRAAGATPALAKLLADPAAEARKAAADALGQIGPAARAAISALEIRARSDDDEGVRKAASAAARALRPSDAAINVPTGVH